MALVTPEETGRDVWLEAALRMLLESGVDTVSIAGLARSLGVTRGAFYWHFDSRDALLSTLLPLVAQKALPPVFDELVLMDRETGYLALLDHAFLPDNNQLHANRYRRALERWAETDRHARSAILHLLATRRHLLGQFLRRTGTSASQSRIHANVLDRLLDPRPENERDSAGYATDLARLFRHLSSEPLSPARLSQHLNRTLPARRLSCWEVQAAPVLPQSEPQQQ